MRGRSSTRPKSTPNGAVAERGLVVVTVLPIDNVPWLVAVLQTESDGTIL